MLKKRYKNTYGLDVMINTNENCNLACKYCYEINKKHKVLPLDYAKKFIDIILADPDPIYCVGTELQDILDNKLNIGFVGGDSLMYPELLDSILSYYVYKANVLDHKWKSEWITSISTNCTLFGNAGVRNFISKWKKRLSLNVSIDGCPAIHDKNRIFAELDPSGKEIGSMYTIIKWWPWLQENCPQAVNRTKATCNKDSIPYLYESLQFLHEELGMTNIIQTFAMEDFGYTDNDYIILEEQLSKCVDYVFNHRDEVYWSMIDKCFDTRSFDEDETNLDDPFCGSGTILTLSTDGEIYPCARWLPSSQKQKNKKFYVGNVWEGLTHKENLIKIRQITRRQVSPDKCIKCKYEHVCRYCIAGCYSEFGCFKRTTYTCEITKLQCKAAEKYWDKIHEIEMIQRETEKKKVKEKNEEEYNRKILLPEPKLIIYSAGDNKVFKRVSDNVIFGNKISLSENDSLNNYIQVDGLVEKYTTQTSILKEYNYTISNDKKTFGINIFERGPCATYEYFYLQPDGPKGEFPIGKWINLSAPFTHEELIISDYRIHIYSDIFKDQDYYYKIDNKKFYLMA